MSRRTILRILKWASWIVGALAGVLFVVLVILISYVPGSDKDRVIEAIASPDGKTVAEIHNIVTPMWGGADRLEFSLRAATDTRGDIVHSRMFECSNLEEFKILWRSSNNIDVVLGHCDSGSYNGVPSDNIAYQKQTAWHEVRITYTSGAAKH